MARPSRTACLAMADVVMRSAQRPPHHVRSSGVAKHQAPGRRTAHALACPYGEIARANGGEPDAAAPDGRARCFTTRRPRPTGRRRGLRTLPRENRGWPRAMTSANVSMPGTFPGFHDDRACRRAWEKTPMGAIRRSRMTVRAIMDPRAQSKRARQ
jgi:hypothetical protein